ncbi:MAG TPA: hypothetical protein VFU94_02485 [Conexibacter sp.]|nr:hypothetical protein [Conexibacter sp.]
MFSVRIKLGDALIWCGMKLRQLSMFFAAIATVAIPAVLIGKLLGDKSFPLPFGGAGGLGTYIWQDVVLLIALWWIGRLLIPAALMAVGNLIWPSDYRRTVNEIYGRAFETSSQPFVSEGDWAASDEKTASSSFRDASAKWRQEYDA